MIPLSTILHSTRHNMHEPPFGSVSTSIVGLHQISRSTEVANHTNIVARFHPVGGDTNRECLMKRHPFTWSLFCLARVWLLVPNGTCTNFRPVHPAGSAVELGSPRGSLGSWRALPRTVLANSVAGYVDPIGPRLTEPTNCELTPIETCHWCTKVMQGAAKDILVR